MTISFAANHATVGANDDEAGICVKISGVESEMNVWLPLDTLHLLELVPSTRWARGALKLGTSANANVWWSCDAEQVFVAVGPDDETWDFGIHFPLTQFADLRAAIDEELATNPH